MSRVGVVGVGLVKVKEHWGESLESLFTQAALKALEEAGVEVDKLYVGNMCGPVMQNQLNLGAHLAQALGVHGLPAIRVEAGSASGGLAVHEAYQAVKSGKSKAALVVGVEKMSDVLPEDVSSALSMEEDYEYTAYTGVTKSGVAAMVHRMYLDSYATAEDVCMMAVKSHEHAEGCSHAQYPFRMSLERAMASPMEADPIHMMECSGVGDGAAAVVLAPLEGGGVELAGTAVSTDYSSLAQRKDPLFLESAASAARKAYEEAGVGPSDVGLAEVHDDFTITGLLSIEALGLAGKGEAWRMVVDGEVDLGGRLPVNTFGGLKARGNPLGATGVYQVAELYLQLSGSAGDHQVDKADVGVALNMGGLGSTSVVNVLRRVEA